MPAQRTPAPQPYNPLPAEHGLWNAVVHFPKRDFFNGVLIADVT